VAAHKYFTYSSFPPCLTRKPHQPTNRAQQQEAELPPCLLPAHARAAGVKAASKAASMSTPPGTHAQAAGRRAGGRKGGPPPSRPPAIGLLLVIIPVSHAKHY
jgi:hypothetical protein